MSPPFRKLTLIIRGASPPGPSSSSSDVGRDAGALFADGRAGRGSGVPQISHAGSDGWFRNVHAGHACPAGVSTREGGSEAARGDRCAEAVGREEERGGSRRARGGAGTATLAVGIAARGTPQSPQTIDADGLSPGGLR